MLEVFNSFFEAALRLGHQYGPRVGLGVLVFVAGVIVLRLLTCFLSRGGPKQG
jgi:hypothetical protein